jgi:hypothetical protein
MLLLVSSEGTLSANCYNYRSSVVFPPYPPSKEPHPTEKSKISAIRSGELEGRWGLSLNKEVSLFHRKPPVDDYVVRLKCKLVDPNVPDETPEKVDQSPGDDPPTPKATAKE